MGQGANGGEVEFLGKMDIAGANEGMIFMAEDVCDQPVVKGG
jgi:hypothetical protein